MRNTYKKKLLYNTSFNIKPNESMYFVLVIIIILTELFYIILIM